MPANIYYVLKKDIRPIKDHILAINMEKGEKIANGLIIMDDNGRDRGIRPRWCQVYKTGEGVDYVQPGQWILVEHGKWTWGVPLVLEENDNNELTVQRIDVTGILGVQDTKPEWI